MSKTLPFRAPYGAGPEVEALVRVAALHGVQGCPHLHLTPWLPWPDMQIEIATCHDCGTTISREAE